MKKHVLPRTNLAVVRIIVADCLEMLWLNVHSFNKILEDDIENITRLTSSTIHKDRPGAENGFDARLKEADTALYLSKARARTGSPILMERTHG